MSKDTISDILTCIRNAAMANKETVRIGFTNIVEKIVQILLREGFIKNTREHRENKKSFLEEELSDEESESESDSDANSDSDEDSDPHRRRTPRIFALNPCPCCRAVKRLARILVILYVVARYRYRRGR